MSNGIEIRLCEARDLPAVSDLLTTTWHATYDAIYGSERVTEITRQWHSVEALRRNLGVTDGIFLVGVREAKILGTTFARFDAETGIIQLDRIYVHPDAQGTGIGYALLGETIQRAGPATRLRLEVEPGNARAIAFYERAGFRKAGHGTDCGGFSADGGVGIEHLIMEREL